MRQDITVKEAVEVYKNIKNADELFEKFRKKAKKHLFEFLKGVNISYTVDGDRVIVGRTMKDGVIYCRGLTITFESDGCYYKTFVEGASINRPDRLYSLKELAEQIAALGL